MQIKNPAFSDQKKADPYAATEDRVITVRCGKCEGCLKTNINNWAFRLEQEARRSQFVHFVTLTYTPEFVPLTPTLLPTLDKVDVQKWFKRLRKLTGKGVKYFIVGEYGSKSYRPHYHAIIFNVKNPDHYSQSWTRDGKPLGNVHIGNDIDNGAIPYTLKYMYKKGLVPAFKDDDRLKEFRLMSQKLGLNYLSDAMLTYHLEDFPNRQTVRLKSGINVAMPRYFRDRIINDYDIDRSTLIPPEQPDPILDNPNISPQGVVEAIKSRQTTFEKKRNQQQRKTL